MSIGGTNYTDKNGLDNKISLQIRIYPCTCADFVVVAAIGLELVDVQQGDGLVAVGIQIGLDLGAAVVIGHKRQHFLHGRAIWKCSLTTPTTSM